jgi:hypothetical protein
MFTDRLPYFIQELDGTDEATTEQGMVKKEIRTLGEDVSRQPSSEVDEMRRCDGVSAMLSIGCLCMRRSLQDQRAVGHSRM